MILYSTGTVFSYWSIVSWGLGSKDRIPYFHTYERARDTEREREKVHCKHTMYCTAHFIITLFKAGNVLL